MLATIRVLKKDIDKGIQLSATRCPIARAVARYIAATKSLRKAFLLSPCVCPEYVEFFGRRGAPFRRVPLPAVVKSFVSSFDSYGFSEVRPFSFLLEIPRASSTKAK